MIGIYKITNKLNGKSYIGQSIHCDKRFKEHCSGKKQFIDETIQLEGEENFTFELLEECERDKLNEREDYYIAKYNTMFPNGYNKRWNTSTPTEIKQEEEIKQQYHILYYDDQGDFRSATEFSISCLQPPLGFSLESLKERGWDTIDNLKYVQKYRTDYFPQKVSFNFNLKSYKNNIEAKLTKKEYGFYQNFLARYAIVLNHYTGEKRFLNTYPFLVQQQCLEIKMPILRRKDNDIKIQIEMFRKLKERNMIKQIKCYDINKKELPLPEKLKAENVRRVEFIEIS